MTNIKIAPSLLSANFAHMAQEIATMEAAGADLFHIDVMDGHFVPNLALSPDMVKAIRPLTRKPLDAHLMVTNPANFIDPFAAAGVNMLSFHIEIEDNPTNLIDRIHTHKISAGLVLKPDTPPHLLFPYLDQIDFVLCMTVQPGFSGGKFEDKGLENLRQIQAEIQRRNLTLPIEVDGAVSKDTIGVLKAAGAKIFVAGSAAFKGGPACYGSNLRALR